MKISSSTAIIKDSQLQKQQERYDTSQRKDFQNQNQVQFMRINADNQTKKQLLILLIIFLSHVVLVGVLSLASIFYFYSVPQPFITINNKLELSKIHNENCTQQNFAGKAVNTYVQCQSFNQSKKLGLIMLNIQKSNQFAFVYMNFYVQNASLPLIIQDNLNVILYQFEVQKVQGVQKMKLTNQIQKQNNKIYWRPVALQKDNQMNLYLTQMIGYIHSFQYSNLFLSLQFSSNFTAQANLKSMKLEAIIVNQKYTEYSIIIRLFYCFASLCFSFFYIKQILNNSNFLISIEQKLIFVLSILLVMFNDPLYAITVLYPNQFSSFLSVFFIVNFIVGLFFCWIIFIDRIVFENGVFQTNQFKNYKIIWGILFYLCLFIIYFLYANNKLDQNLVFAQNEIYQNKYIGLFVITLILFAISTIYLGVQYIRIFINFKSKIWRNQIFTLFSLFFIVLSIVMFYLGSFQLYDYQSSRLLIVYVALNLYIFSLQFLYSEAKRGRTEDRNILNQVNQVQFEEVVVSQEQKEENKGQSKSNINNLNLSSQSKRKRRRKVDRIKQTTNQQSENDKNQNEV